MFYKIRVISDNLITESRLDDLENWMTVWVDRMSVIGIIGGLCFLAFMFLRLIDHQ